MNPMKHRMIRAALYALATSLCMWMQITAAEEQSAAVGASNAIERIDFSQISGQTLVKVTMRNALSRAPEPYTLYNPQPKLFFDFLNTENVSGVSSKQASLPDLQSINVVQSGQRTRLVLNLYKSAQFNSRLEGNTLWISLSPSVAAAATTAASGRSGMAPASGAASAATGQGNSVQNVDFQAESANLAVLRVDVAEPNPVLDVKRQGMSLVLVLPQVGLPDRLARRLDVRDFGTPVLNATSTAIGQGSQLVIANRGEWDYSVTQLDTSIRVEIRRLIQDPNSLVGSKELQGKTISFNFTQPVPVSQMMGIFQDITGLNFVMMPGVTGEIERLKMENTPVETAINVVSRMYGLSMRRYGEVVVVGRASDLARYEKEDHDLQAARVDAEPIEQEAVKIRYRPVAEIVAALTGTAPPPSSVPATANGSAPAAPAGGAQGATTAATGKSLISSRGSISSDPVTNMIFVEETRSQLNKIRERVSVLDVPIRQVMIEARIVSVTNNFARSLGTKLSFQRVPNNATPGGTVPISSNAISTANTSLGPAPRLGFSGGFDPAAGSKATDIVYTLFNSNQTRILQLELSASENDGLSKSIANPKILTQDGRQATITDGSTLYFQLSGGTSGPTTVAVDAATKLDVTPQINSDGKVALKVDVTKASPGATVGANVSVVKQQVVTNVVVENGGTLMLGGVFTDQDSTSNERVPILGDIPYVGWLFRQTTKTRNRSELLIFLTPRIVTEELTLQ